MGGASEDGTCCQRGRADSAHTGDGFGFLRKNRKNELLMELVAQAVIKVERLSIRSNERLSDPVRTKLETYVIMAKERRRSEDVKR